ncbi:C-C motif chemokine ligand 1 [Rhinolophus ferrumequinum]|uniref:C-C motif chemokine n=1 Tax=Rhinolophus ferrumequinum TaxID=59479 RepID=A0A7J7TCL7_RHIFE|nr:C-C motif chemokine 1 [Rhinolophus ferrumequinum]KAF6298210.1 C-C motif chemokine ligand 1 [Rhinolophus ferrumequinum]
MKLITMALVCLLVAGMCLQAVDSRSLHVSTSHCCFAFAKKKIPLKKIHCYKYPSSSCSHSNGVIFNMKSGARICALKKDKWVEDSLEGIDLCGPAKI